MTKDYQGKNLTSKSLLLLKEALFLANLVNANVKPLARIEYPITEKLYALFEKMGLILDEIKQDVANGKIVHIIIISKHQDMIDKAKSIFNGKPLCLDVDTFWNWGKLLGIPECCIKFFIDEETRHSPNNFLSREQALLFHWACPNCKDTKQLIPLYKKIWEETQEQFKTLKLY